MESQYDGKIRLYKLRVLKNTLEVYKLEYLKAKGSKKLNALERTWHESRIANAQYAYTREEMG